MTIRLIAQDVWSQVDPLQQGAIGFLKMGLIYSDIESPLGITSMMSDTGVFPTGLLERVLKLLEARGFVPQIQDDRSPGTTPQLDLNDIPLWDYQERALREMVQHRRGILQAVPRSGKTRMAAALFKVFPELRPALFLVEGTELGLQAQASIEELLGDTVGHWGGGSCSGGDVVVAMRQTLINHLHNPHIQQCRMAIVDEVHHAASDQFKVILRELPKCERLYGLSATPWTTDGRDILLEANVGPLRHQVTYEDLLASNRPDTGEPFLCPQTMIFQYMPEVPGLSRTNDWRKVEKAAIVENQVRNQAICDFANALMSWGCPVLITVERAPHGEILSDMLNIPFTHGASGKGHREDVLEALTDGTILGAVSTLYKEAIDIPRLVGYVNAAGLKSSIAFYQRPRNMTYFPGKKVALTLDFMDMSKFVSDHSQTRYRLACEESTFRRIMRNDYARAATVSYDWLYPATVQGIQYIDQLVAQKGL